MVVGGPDLLCNGRCRCSGVAYEGRGRIPRISYATLGPLDNFFFELLVSGSPFCCQTKPLVPGSHLFGASVYGCSGRIFAQCLCEVTRLLSRSPRIWQVLFFTQYLGGYMFLVSSRVLFDEFPTISYIFYEKGSSEPAIDSRPTLRGVISHVHAEWEKCALSMLPLPDFSRAVFHLENKTLFPRALLIGQSLARCPEDCLR